MSDSPPAPPPRSFALWNLGFRPFYLLAGLFATIAISHWIAQIAGWTAPGAHPPDPLWHAHEMIFGYVFAVVTGFLFTAVRNWTNAPTPAGATLAAIAGLWVAARLFALAHWTAFAVIDVPARRLLQIALDLVLFLMAVVGGRVIPMFTANGIPGTHTVRKPWLERTALGSVLLLIAADLLALPAPAMALIAGTAAMAHAARLWLWQPWRTLHKPIVWILHASYAWIVIHLMLRALAMLDVVPASAATHALTVGAIGGLTLGMMTRTARGHIGLPLQVETMETAAYVLVHTAAVVRVFVPLAAPGWYLQAITTSGLLWACAFALFTLKFCPLLVRPRVDGRSG